MKIQEECPDRNPGCAEGTKTLCLRPQGKCLHLGQGRETGCKTDVQTHRALCEMPREENLPRGRRRSRGSREREGVSGAGPRWYRGRWDGGCGFCSPGDGATLEVGELRGDVTGSLCKGWGSVAAKGGRWGQGGQEWMAERVRAADRGEESHGQPGREEA